MYKFDNQGHSQFHENEPTELKKLCKYLPSPAHDRFGGERERHGEDQPKDDARSAEDRQQNGTSGYQPFICTIFPKHVSEHDVQKTAETPIKVHYRGSTPRSLTVLRRVPLTLRQ